MDDNDSATERSLACPVCDLSQTVGAVPGGARVHCARCDHLLFRDMTGQGNQRIFCFALTALLLFVPANLLPILEVTTFGSTRSYTVLSGTQAIWRGSMWPLAVPIGLASAVLPFCLILGLLSLALSDRLRLPATAKRFWRRVCDFLEVWSIVDVYLIAIFVTVSKLAQMTDAAPTGGAALFFGMVLFLALALRSLDDQEEAKVHAAPPTADSLNRTLAWGLAALVLFVPANVYPTLTLALTGSSQSDTVFGGVVELWQDGSWGLALLVMCASVLIPFFKITGLLFLVLTIKNKGRRLERTRLYLTIEKIGRLSMLDFYVISLMVAVMSLGALASARAEIGAVAFASVVIVTIIAARSFDPRLIWSDHRDPPSPE